jgi:hypothetical protein
MGLFSPQASIGTHGRAYICRPGVISIRMPVPWPRRVIMPGARIVLRARSMPTPRFVPRKVAPGVGATVPLAERRAAQEREART